MEVFKLLRDISEDKRIFRLVEDCTRLPVSAPFTSHGTANILALVLALYFTKSNVIVIENPDCNIHPGLLMHLAGMMREAPLRGMQIIITTHSPEILGSCDLDDIISMSRDGEGFSVLSKPGANAEISITLTGKKYGLF